MKHQEHPYAVPFERDGEPVTITVDQFHALWHAIGVWSRMCEEEGSRQADPCHWWMNAYKSRALGRLLIEGKPLFKDVPPRSYGAADYPAWDAENEQA